MCLTTKYETYFTSTDLILENKIPELLISFNQTLAKGFDGHHYIAGLASHFRDLLVSKTPQTIELLEVGEDISKKYLVQSQKTSQEFLMKGIELANDCDLKYKTSKNQRLLVELCLMQLASITFDGEKKNSKNFIVPPSYFRAKGIKPIQVTLPEKTQEIKSSSVVPDNFEVIETIKTSVVEDPITEELLTSAMVKEPRKIILKTDKKRVSGLSLSSIRTKKEFEIRQLDVIIDEDNLPKEDFNEEALLKIWNSYIETLEKQGKFNLASILSIDIPRLNETTIHLTYPNETNKVEIERHQYKLLSFLRKKLNNFSIDLSIDVNEEMEKKYAYTPREKYEKLNDKNNNLDTLRKAFDLDI